MAKKEEATKKDDAPKKAETTSPHGKWERVWEVSQNVAIIGGIILGLRQPPKAGSQVFEGKEIPGWVLNLFPSFTREDETEFNLILDSHPHTDAKKIEATFRETFIEDGYDETKYRLGLVHFRREYLERMRSPMPEDKSGGRLGFNPITLKDSANEFLSELVVENSAGGTPVKIIYERQKRIALNRKLLEKVGMLKKMLLLARENKIEALILLALSPFVILGLIYQVLNFFFG